MKQTEIPLSSFELEKWIDDYSGILLERAYYLLSNKEDAKDVVQEVFLSACKGKASFRGKSSPLTWLTSILHHKIADIYKKRYSEGGTSLDFESVFDKHGEWKETDVMNPWEQEEHSTDVLLNDEGFCRTFDRCMEHLPERWHVAVKLCYIEGRKAAEICKEMNLSANNYWKILQRSRLQLRECIETHWFNNK